MKKIIPFILIMGLCSCQRACTRINRTYQTSRRDYEVIMYSGGDTVFYDKFHGIINDAENSDGCYYYKGDTLVEISGDYIIKSDK